MAQVHILICLKDSREKKKGKEEQGQGCGNKEVASFHPGKVKSAGTKLAENVNLSQAHSTIPWFAVNYSSGLPGSLPK